MQYLKAGKFIKEKRKKLGFTTQKVFINALQSVDSDISCSESYISLIEAGEKSPSVHLLDVIATVLKLSHSEKGELLLIYKRVPADLAFAVKDNLKKSLKITNIDILKKQYEKNKGQKNFNNLIRALVIDGETEEALNLLKSPPEQGANFIDYQVRTAKMAMIADNYDFAVSAFKLALQSCPDEFTQTKADLLMNLGIAYFSKALKIQYENPIDSLEFLIQSKNYLQNSLKITSDNIYCLDEYARCLYHIGDTLDYFEKNELAFKVTIPPHLTSPAKGEEYSNNVSFEIPGNGNLDGSTTSYSPSQSPSTASHMTSPLTRGDKGGLGEGVKKFHFQKALETYKKILSHSEKGDLPEKALKEAVYFHAYTHCKLELFEESLVLINSIIILEQNWLTYFLKAGYALMRYEKEHKTELLDQSIKNLTIAMEYDRDTVKYSIKKEKNRELKTLWELKFKELNTMLQETKND